MKGDTAPYFRRKVRIWSVPTTNPRPGHTRDWVWHCTLCHPDTFGCCQSWQRAIRNARRHYERNRVNHHDYVSHTAGSWVPAREYIGRIMTGDIWRDGKPRWNGKGDDRP